MRMVSNAILLLLVLQECQGVIFPIPTKKDATNKDATKKDGAHKNETKKDATHKTHIHLLFEKNIWLFLASILLVKLTWSGFVWVGPFLYQVHVQRRYFLAVKYFTLCLCFIIQHLATVFMFRRKILCCAYFIFMTRCRTNHMLLVPESIG